MCMCVLCDVIRCFLLLEPNGFDCSIALLMLVMNVVVMNLVYIVGPQHVPLVV